MGSKPVDNDRVVANVQWLLCANNSEASANVIAQADGDRRQAFEVLDGVGVD